MFKITLIRREHLEWQIVHAFIKRYLISRANIACLTVIPKDVLVSTRKKTKKDAFDDDVLKLSRMFGRRTDPSLTAKSTKA